jgi:hypothetical protein
MTYTLPERRRAMRATVGGASWMSVPATWPIQLLDLSLGGLAFTSPHAIEVGRTAAIRATLGPEALNCQIRVRWSRQRNAAAPGTSQFEVGAVFLPLDDSSRRALETFLKLSPAE